MLPDQTDVLIVGAGPTGLALACALRKAGVDHVLIEQRTESQNTSRAAVVHAHTLEALEAIDVVAPLSARGRSLSSFTIRDRDRALLAVHFGDLPSAFRHILMVPQSTMESVLQARLMELGGIVHRGITALGARRDGESAAVDLKCMAEKRTIRARFVVGADGMHSMVREAAGIAFHGDAYGASFVLADVRMDWPLGSDEVSLFFSAAGLVVVAPLPDGSFRVVATLDDAPERPQVQHIQQLLDERGPTAQACRVNELVWSSRFRVHHRLAETYRRGPFLLMGDAAHVHSPAGGQGMNTGLVDAILLGDALARVVRDRSPGSVLDQYSRLRRPAAEQVLALAGRLTHLATLRPPPLRTLRNLLLRLLDRLPPFKRSLALNLSGIARRRFSKLAVATDTTAPKRSAAGEAHRSPAPTTTRLASQGR